jgi:hypothetical protein
MRKVTLPKSSRGVALEKASALPAGYTDVRIGIVELLNSARQAVARNVNALMTASYWEIGRLHRASRTKRQAPCRLRRATN